MPGALRVLFTTRLTRAEVIPCFLVVLGILLLVSALHLSFALGFAVCILLALAAQQVFAWLGWSTRNGHRR